VKDQYMDEGVYSKGRVLHVEKNGLREPTSKAPTSKARGGMGGKERKREENGRNDLCPRRQKPSCDATALRLDIRLKVYVYRQHYTCH